jgi:hypothetical protein
MDQANGSYMKKDYGAAVIAYKAVVAAEPANALAWYRLAVSQQSLGTLDDAAANYGQALKLGFDAFSVYYRLATLEGARGDEPAAMGFLEKANAARRIPPGDLETDAALAPVRSDPRFAALIDANARFFYPCTFDQRYRFMDFWIGDWDVSNKAGNQIGSSHIEQINNSCALLENWTAGGANTGKSFTFYDVERDQWVQHWVDGQGGYLDFAGHPDGKSLVFLAPTFNPSDHKPAFRRMTFTPLDDGRVRQLIETSPDGKSHWTIAFDGYYAKRVSESRTSPLRSR